MNKKFNNHAVLLAALLHDIGKLSWRADNHINEIPHMEEAGLRFFEEVFAGKECIRPLKDEIVKLLQEHDNPMFDLIAKADKLEIESGRGKGNGNRNALPLESILAKVELTEPAVKDTYSYNPHPLSLNEIFPQNEFANKNSDTAGSPGTSAYKDIFQGLKTELAALKGDNIVCLIDSVIFLYEKYLSFVSSSVYSEHPEVSLFDHSRTIGALSACYNECDDADNPFLIIAADISGIQNFIYSDQNPIENSARGLNKRLRGKSFYMILLTDTFADYILGQFNLSRASLLINGGGHFILLAPNNRLNREKLQNIKVRIQKWFFLTFKGNLNLVVESLEAGSSLYMNYPEWHNRISNLLLKAKKLKNIDILSEAFHSYNLDEVEKQEFEFTLKEEDREKYYQLNGFEKRLYNFERLFEETGLRMPKSEYVLEIFCQGKDNIKYDRFESTLISFNDFDIHWLFIRDKKELENFIINNNASSFSLVRILKINRTDVTDTELQKIVKNLRFNVSAGFKFIGKAAPLNEQGFLKEFEELAGWNKEEEKELDYPLLAVLRMDVDNLGAIFSFGLERDSEAEDIRTLSRTVGLSRNLNLFFTGFLNILADKWDIYITYSGGDDLFVVGSWINIINFAIDVKNEFRRFACFNSNVSISGGIYLCKPEFPIGKAAALAGENEEKAKNKKHPDGRDKNTISVFGREYRWDEFEEFLNYGRELDKLVCNANKKEAVSQGYIHYLLELTYDMTDADGNINIDKYFSKLAKLKYSLARTPREITHQKIMENENKIPAEANKKVLLLSKLINHYESVRYLANFIVPASYIIFKNRKLKK